MQQFHINKPTFKPTFYANEKKSPKELLSPQIIFIFIEGSPVNKSVKYQNRGTMGVQIPFSFPKGLDFKPFQAKVRVLPWHTNNTLIIFLYLHLNLVFLLKRLIFQGFPTFEFSFLFKVSSQIFSYFLMLFPAILVNPLVKQASLPTGFFNYSLSDILLPLHHQNSHGCKCSRLH